MDTADATLALSALEINLRHWCKPKRVARREAVELRAAERELFERYAAQLAGEVLQLGCRRFPGRSVVRLDVLRIGGFDDERLDAIILGHMAIDVLDDRRRRLLLDELRRVLAPGGVLIFSSHNLACESLVAPPSRNLALHPVRLLNRLARMPTALRNRAQLGPLQRRELGYAILNDSAHDYSLLHYYIGRDGQAAQLAEHGLHLIECLDLDGRAVPAGETAYGCHELHYVAVVF